MLLKIALWLVETLGLDALKIWLASRKSTAEQLGEAEEKSENVQAELKTEKAMSDAVMEAPHDKQSLVEALHADKVCIVLGLLSLMGCAQAAACPSIWPRTAAQEDEIAANFSTLPDNSPLIGVGVEWAQLRAEAKACSGD